MRAPLLLLFALACSSGESGSAPPETPTSEATGDSPEPETQNTEPEAELEPESDPGEQRLDPATGFDQGCSTDADCVIATDPCARASAVHRDRQQAFRDQFANRRYRCARHEYPAEPVAYCRDSRCVGVVPAP